MRYGLTTYALTSRTIATAPTIVTIQSSDTRNGQGARVSRSTGFRDACARRALGRPLGHCLRRLCHCGISAGRGRPSGARHPSRRIAGSVMPGRLCVAHRSSMYALDLPWSAQVGGVALVPAHRSLPASLWSLPPPIDPTVVARESSTSRTSPRMPPDACSAGTRGRRRAPPRSSDETWTLRRARRAGSRATASTTTIAGSSHRTGRTGRSRSRRCELGDDPLVEALEPDESSAPLLAPRTPRPAAGRAAALRGERDDSCGGASP